VLAFWSGISMLYSKLEPSKNEKLTVIGRCITKFISGFKEKNEFGTNYKSYYS
jgi:hypothetical protein